MRHTIVGPALPDEVVESIENAVDHAADWYDEFTILLFWFSGSIEVSSLVS